MTHDCTTFGIVPVYRMIDCVIGTLQQWKVESASYVENASIYSCATIVLYGQGTDQIVKIFNYKILVCLHDAGEPSGCLERAILWNGWFVEEKLHGATNEKYCKLDL